MFVFFVGIIVLIIGFSTTRIKFSAASVRTSYQGAGLGIAAIGLLMTSLVQIEPGEVGVRNSLVK